MSVEAVRSNKAKIAPARQGSALSAIVAAAVIVLAGGYLLRFDYSPLMIVALAVPALIALFFIFALMSGTLVFARGEKRQNFHDAIADAASAAFVVVDERGRATYANSGFMTLAAEAGASRLVGFDVLFAGYQAFSEAVYQLGQAAQARQSMFRDVRVGAGEKVPGASSDEPRWLRLSVAPVNAEGQGPHVLWRLDDITRDRLHQEEAFSRLQSIITYLDNSPAGFFSTLANGRVDYLNATLAGWLGIDIASAQGGKISLSELVGEDTARQLTAVVPHDSNHHIAKYLVTLQCKDGSPLPVEIINRTDFDINGKVLPSRSMVLRREAAEQSSMTASSLDELIQIAPFGLAEVDQAGVLKRANAAFLGLSNGLAQGKALRDSIAPAETADLQAAISQASATPAVLYYCDVSFAGDTARNVHLSFVRLLQGDGNTLVFALDKTENKALEVQLAQSQKMQAVGQLASGIAHDFNNVLTPIIGFADLLLAKMRPTDPSFADVMNIKQNANRAANLVRQLLAFSRKQTMQPRIHSLTEAMSDLGNLLGRVLGERIELSIVHSRDLGAVMVDVHQFEQVIINLAVNARDAMPNGGKLEVRTRNVSRSEALDTKPPLPDGEYVLCEVEDTGSGIPKEILEKIWEPFFSTKEVGKGTGLGLSMVYGIIKQTGGFIYCDSVLGQGTTFRIYLPRIYPEVVVGPAPVRDEPAKQKDFTGKGRILIVEDEDSVRAFAVRALTSRGYTVREANSGEVGLEVIENDKDGFELILSDVVMPEMDGPSMLAELRKRGIGTKIIFMSGYAEDAFERNLENPDDFAFLQKPFSLKQLAEKVKDVMG
jgi:two-component system, cell cycle sensor histidine kinase and response regulator CckA